MRFSLRRRVLAWVFVVGLALSVTGSRADTLVADLSEHFIAITTAFVGTKVVLFGTTEGRGDVVITVVGPRHDQEVRRKARVAGIWINRDRLVFKRVPSYYAVASSGPLDRIAHPDVAARLELGTAHLKLEPVDAEDFEIDEIMAFRAALARNKARQGLYTVEPLPVSFVDERLFRATVYFPANVPPGIYQVQVFQLRDGQVVDAQRSSLVISKVGLEAELFDFAREQSALYGLLAIVTAIASGWLAGIIFRRE